MQNIKNKVIKLIFLLNIVYLQAFYNSNNRTDIISQTEFMGQQQSSQYQHTHFSHRFIANSHPLYPQMTNLKLLHEKLTSKQYILNVLATNDQIQRIKLQNLICKKLANKSTFVTNIEQYIFDQIDGYCGKVNKCYLVVQIGKNSVKSLKHFLLQKQCQKQRGFPDSLLEQSIQQICSAILWLKFVDHSHGNLSTETIYYDSLNNIFILSDPWIAPLRQNSAGQYPSPQKLAKINNQTDEEDPFLSDLFSYGMVILEILFGGLNVYKPNYKIDIKKIVNFVGLVECQSLKQKLRVMLVGNKQQKNRLLYSHINNIKNANETIRISNNTDQRRNSFLRQDFTFQRNIPKIYQKNGIQGKDQPQQSGFPNVKFKSLGGTHIGSFSKSFKMSESTNKNEKPPQVQLITNANTNGYQKLSRFNPNPNAFANFKMPLKNFDGINTQMKQKGFQNKEIISTKNNNLVQHQTQIQRLNILPLHMNLYNTSQPYVFPSATPYRFEAKNQDKDISYARLIQSKNVQIAVSHIFQPKEVIFPKQEKNSFIQGDYCQKKINQAQLQSCGNLNSKTDYSVMKIQTKNDLNTKNYDNRLFASDFTNYLEQPQLKDFRKSQKFVTQGTPNDTPNHSRNNSNIFNSQNSQDNIINNNANLVGKINQGFNSLQNKITSAFTYESTIINEKDKEQLIKSVIHEGQCPNNYQYNIKPSNFLENIKVKSNFTNINKQAVQQKKNNSLSNYLSQKPEKELKNEKEGLSGGQMQKKSCQTNIKLQIQKNSKDEEANIQQQQKSIDFPETPSSLVKIDQNKNTLQYARYLTKNSEQRIKSAERVKNSPELQEIMEREAASPPTKAGPSTQRQNQQYFLSYSYSDSNPAISSQIQSIHIENQQMGQPRQQTQSISYSEQNENLSIQNKLSPTCGLPLKQVRNLIIYEESDGDSDSSTRQKYRGDPVEEIYENGGRYKGFILDGKRDGQGTFYYKDGGYYKGSWKNNMMNGFGKLYYDTGKLAYEGNWYKDQFHGRGKVYNDSPELLQTSFDYTDFENIELYWQYYEGDLVHDSKEGSGKIMLSNGESFEGQFHNDKVHGKGIFKTVEGRVVRGIWQNCKLVKVIN